MEGKDNNNNSCSIVNGTTDREACLKFWYVVKVRPCCEKQVAKKLSSLGIDAYVPSQMQMRQWSDRKKKIDVILIPTFVFVHIQSARLPEIQKFSFILGLLRAPGNKEVATIPLEQIERLKRITKYQEESIKFIPQDFSAGDTVTICRGVLKGLSGLVKEESQNKTKIGIHIDYLGCAMLSISKSDIVLTKQL